MTVQYNDEEGWARIDDLLSPERAQAVSTACTEILDGPSTGHNQNDKASGGTRRLFDVVARVPEANGIPELVEPVVAQILAAPFQLTEASFRCPGPGFGEQRLHIDTVAQPVAGLPPDTATALVALVPFTEKNGATRLVPGSHRRPDLQQKAGSLDHHRDEIRLRGPIGTAFVFSGHVLHSGTKNESDLPRPALQLVFRTAGRQWPER